MSDGPDSGDSRPTPGKILRSPIAYGGLAVGLAIFAGVIAWQGIGDVTVAFGRAGWWVAAIALFHLPSLAADGMGWRSLLPPGRRPSARSFIGARWIGESINDLLPVLQMGGNVVKAWFLMRRGADVGLAGASVVVDVTLVVFSQIIFTLVGLALLVLVIGRSGSLATVLIGSAIFSLLLAGFYAVQRRGFFAFIVRASRRILGGPPGKSAAHDGAAAIDAAILELYRNRGALLASGAWHILAWVLGVAEVWFALYLLERPVDLFTALLFESLGQAIRTGAFAVPGGLGVQEGGYVVVGAVLGIDAPVAIALSLARRVRELLLGLPGLAAWQVSALRDARRAPDAGRSATPDSDPPAAPTAPVPPDA